MSEIVKATTVIEDIRTVAGAKGEFTSGFKKSFWGLEKKEVDECINQMSLDLKKAEKTFEEKLSEMQNSINMIKRERDSLSNSAEALNKRESEYQNKILILNVQLTEQREKASSLAGLEDTCKELFDENQKLQGCARLYEELKITNAELTAKSEVNESENLKLKEKNQALEAKVQKLTDECMALQKTHQLKYKEMKIDIHQQLSKDKIIVDKVKQQIYELNEAVDSLNLSVVNL